MLLAGILLLGALEIQGNLELSLDKAVYPVPDRGMVFELYYDIPYTSLTFLRQDDSFAARFTVGVQLVDRRGDPLAGDMWQRTVTVSEYQATIAADSAATDMVSLSVPEAVKRCRVEVTDLSSDRAASAEFSLESAESKVRIRLLKSGRPNPSRAYRLNDTLEVHAELLLGGVGCDSFRFLVKDGRRVVTGGTVAATDSNGRRAAVFVYPVADSTGTAQLPAGEYAIEVSAFGAGPSHDGRSGFSVIVPFFADEKAFREKVDELVYIATTSEIAELKRVPAGQREEAWNRFWRQKDPTPTTERNEWEEEYFRRIEYAKSHFGGGDKGYRSDRGRVYVKLGPPDNVDSRPFELDSRPREIWHYYSLGMQFVFVDRYGFGEYSLESPKVFDVR